MTDIGAGRQRIGGDIATNHDVATCVVGIAAVGLDGAVDHDATLGRQQSHGACLCGRGVNQTALRHLPCGARHCIHDRGGLHEHLPALGHDHTIGVVGHAGLQGGGRDFKANLVAQRNRQVGGQAHRLASGHDHLSALGRDRAAVGNVAAHQGHIAALLGLDDAAVLDLNRRVAAVAIELVKAVEEIVITQIKSRGSECRGSHRTRSAKHQAIGVDQ